MIKWIKTQWKRFWKWLLFSGAVGTVVLVASVVSASVTIPSSLDIQTNNFQSAIEIAQEEYLQTHGEYFQGLPNTTSIPGKAITSDWSRKPEGRELGWNDLFPTLPSETPYQTEIWTYVFPDGTNAYRHFFRIKKEDGIYEKSTVLGNGGDDNFRARKTYDWKLINPITATTT